MGRPFSTAAHGRYPRGDRPALLAPIGFVRSACRDRREMPGEGTRARIDVLREHRAHLSGVELTSHLIVLGRFDSTGRPHHGDHEDHMAGTPIRGSFATRTPSRPNRISLTVVRVVGLDEAGVEVEGLDLVDGTPVIDLKPYIPGQDGVFSAVRQWRSRHAAGIERLSGYLVAELRNHLGEHAADPDAMAALDAVLDAAREFRVDPRDRRLRARVNRANAAADALMGLLGATLASGRVIIEPAPGQLTFVFSLGEERSIEIVAADPD